MLNFIFSDDFEWVLGNREDLAKDIIAELQPEGSELRGTSVCHNSEAHNEAFARTILQAHKRKKGKKSDPVFMQLVDNLSNMGKVYEGATESMKKLAETFKHEADGADRRMKVHEELIFAGGGLTDEEIVKVGGIITADCNKTDYFFTLGGHFKKLYVYSLLQKRL
uniref:Uncharacterized protein n=1 Tax=Fagus sylvatica TaxID=28930 RepID=A0A2N9FWI2_FAGSY